MNLFKNIFKNKKAVSPVIATILLISLTVASAAIIYFVVVPYLNQEDSINFGITDVDTFMDYDHDGTVDAITAEITVVTSLGAGAADMTVFDFAITNNSMTSYWVLTELGASLISDGFVADVIIATPDESSELIAGEIYTLRIVSGASIATATFTVGAPIEGTMVTVTVEDTDDDAVSGVEVDFYYSNNAFIGKPTKYTNSEGQVQIALRIGEYKIRARYLGDNYWSSEFYHPKTTSVSIQVGALGPIMTVHVINDLGGIPGLTVFAFDGLNRYAGAYATTDGLGDAYLNIDPGTYVFKVFYLNYNYSSGVIEYPTVNETTINIGGGITYARVVDGDEAGQANVRVYLFSATGSYLGVSMRTNATGFAAFSLTAGGYKFRIDYGGARSWSETFGAADGQIITIYIGGKVYAHVFYGPDELPLNNVRVYMFTASGSYTGRSGRTNQTGYVLFNPVQSDTYFKFRVDYAGGQEWSSEFNGAAAVTIVDINVGAEAYAHVIYGQEGDPLNNVRVYLFTASGRYSGISARTNSTGYARFNGVLKSTNYKFRVDYAGGQFWSEVFNGSTGFVVVDINIGGTVFAYVNYGPTNEPLGNVRVYLFTAAGSYSGISARTNSTGYAQFDGVLATTTYKFRVDYAGGQFWSVEFDGSVDNFVVDINIGGIVYAHVVYGPDDEPLNNVRVYLFTASGRYSGISARTNTTGYARFNGVLGNTQYKFRVDYAAGQFWSQEFNGSQPESVVEINIGGIVYAHVIYGADNDPLNNVRVYLFTASHSYSGISVRTNATGHAQFNGVLSTAQYVFRVDYAGGQFWSTEFNGGLPVYVHDVNIGSRVFCYVHDDGTPVNNVQVYLFTENDVYTGLSVRTNSTGYATFNGTLSTLNYKFRVNYGSVWWTAVFSGGDEGHIESVDVNIPPLMLLTTPIFERIVLVTP
ncbi:MAG: archaellin/type IV pilin N-terminal domain-containing protein [Candidatus Heimdallarchaeota archaeon]